MKSSENHTKKCRLFHESESGVSFIRFLLIIIVTLFCYSSSTVAQPTLIIENGRVIVGNGTVLEQASVVVAGDSIYSVTQKSVKASDAPRIDASSKTILSGLIDVQDQKIIDVHLHSLELDMLPAHWDTIAGYECTASAAELHNQTIVQLKRFSIPKAVTSGDVELFRKLKEAGIKVFTQSDKYGNQKNYWT